MTCKTLISWEIKLVWLIIQKFVQTSVDLSQLEAVIKNSPDLSSKGMIKRENCPSPAATRSQIRPTTPRHCTMHTHTHNTALGRQHSFVVYVNTKSSEASFHDARCVLVSSKNDSGRQNATRRGSGGVSSAAAVRRALLAPPVVMVTVPGDISPVLFGEQKQK